MKQLGDYRHDGEDGASRLITHTYHDDGTHNTKTPLGRGTRLRKLREPTSETIAAKVKFHPVEITLRLTRLITDLAGSSKHRLL